MNFMIREFNPIDEEYLACLAVQHASFPDQPPLTLGEARYSDNEPFKGEFKAKFVIVRDEEIIGCGTVSDPHWIAARDKVSFDYVVHPDHEELASEGRTIHSRIQQYVLDLIADRKVNGLMTRAREDQRVKTDWLETHGYVCKMRMPLSRLDIPGFKFELWRGFVERVEADGIAFYTLEFLKEHDPDWHSKLFDAWAEIYLDVPSPFESQPKTVEEFNMMLCRPSNTPDLWLIGVDNANLDGTQFGPYVGATFVNRMLSAPNVLDIALTGVRQNWRRRGIATAIKLKSIALALEEKATVLKTGNEEDNPLFGINMRLGFKPAPAWLDYEKVLPSI